MVWVVRDPPAPASASALQPDVAADVLGADARLGSRGLASRALVDACALQALMVQAYEAFALFHGGLSALLARAPGARLAPDADGFDLCAALAALRKRRRKLAAALDDAEADESGGAAPPAASGTEGGCSFADADARAQLAACERALARATVCSPAAFARSALGATLGMAATHLLDAGHAHLFADLLGFHYYPVEPSVFLAAHGVQHALRERFAARHGVRGLAVVCDGHLVWNGLGRRTAATLYHALRAREQQLARERRRRRARQLAASAPVATSVAKTLSAQRLFSMSSARRESIEADLAGLLVDADADEPGFPAAAGLRADRGHADGAVSHAVAAPGFLADEGASVIGFAPGAPGAGDVHAATAVWLPELHARPPPRAADTALVGQRSVWWSLARADSDEASNGAVYPRKRGGLTAAQLAKVFGVGHPVPPPQRVAADADGAPAAVTGALEDDDDDDGALDHDNVESARLLVYRDEHAIALIVVAEDTLVDRDASAAAREAAPPLVPCADAAACGVAAPAYARAEAPSPDEPAPARVLALCEGLHAFLAPALARLAACRVSAGGMRSSVIDGCRFVYFNAANLALKTLNVVPDTEVAVAGTGAASWPVACAQLSAHLAPPVLAAMNDAHATMHDACHAADDVQELTVRLNQHGWVVARKFGGRELYALLDSRYSTIAEVQSAMRRLRETLLGNIFCE